MKKDLFKRGLTPFEYLSPMVQRPGPGMPVTVVGLARSGIAAAKWLIRLGCFVRVTEQAETPALKQVADGLQGLGAVVELGKHTPDFLAGSQLVVLSPGVPLDSAVARWARRLGIPMVSELELGSWYCPGKIVAITGSNGKSTVCTLLGQILQAAGYETVVCGNIGPPLCGFLGSIRPSTWVVMEVSSFQSEAFLSFHPEVAMVLNVTTNHLDRHGSFSRYRAAKARLLAYQGVSGWAVLNADDPGSFGLRSQVRGQCAAFSRRKQVLGACAKDGWLQVTLPWIQGKVCRKRELPFPGNHHEENALAAGCVAALLGVEPSVSGSVIRRFKGLPHRQERVIELNGITFINDSKSTTVSSGIRAIEAAQGKVVLIAGGKDKGSDFRELTTWAKKLKKAVLFGEDAGRIAASLKGVVALTMASDVSDAVTQAYRSAGQGDWVVFSPMCTSFDMFRDYEERGERFVEAVHALA